MTDEMTDEDQETIENLRSAKNAAYRMLHSIPSLESKDAYRLATKLYETTRYTLDPVFRAKKIKSGIKAQSNAKLGIPNSKRKKHT